MRHRFIVIGHATPGRDSATAFVISDEGEVSLKAPKYSSVASLAGAAGSLPRSMRWKEQLEIAREDRIAEQYGKRA